MTSLLRLTLPALVLLPPLRAQQIPLARVDGQILPIRAVHGTVPFVMLNGQLRPAADSGAMLQPAPFYRDGFVQLQDFNMLGATERLSFDSLNSGSASTGAVNGTITLSGTLTASQPLENCFLVFEFQPGKGRPAELGTVELPPLAAGKRRSFHVSLSVGSMPDGKQYRIHIFSDGRECRVATAASR
jgi:hypothetical protein